MYTGLVCDGLEGLEITITSGTSTWDTIDATGKPPSSFPL